MSEPIDINNWRDWRMSEAQVHEFIVEVTGCTREQAEQVIAERIDHDEEYGFAYTVRAMPKITDAPNDDDLTSADKIATALAVVALVRYAYLGVRALRRLFKDHVVDSTAEEISSATLPRGPDK